MNISTRLLAGAAYFTVAIGAPILTFAPTAASAQVEIAVAVKIAPPPLVVYDQPPIPAAGYLWTPGYWAWDADDSDYYWAPGAWSQPPQVGYYWTPGYWAWDNGAYAFKVGYWGPAVGYYGGVDYGHGYTSQGYYGGRWRNNTFEYNRTVNNIANVRITNAYEEPAPRGPSETRVSYSGGPGGAQVKPTAEQLAAAKAQHVEATAAQTERFRAAQQDKQAHFKANNGKPPAPVAKVEETPAAGGAMKAPADAKSEAEKPGAKSDMKSEAEKPAMKPETKTEAEKPGVKTEAEHPAVKAIEKAPPEKMQKMDKPAAAGAAHPEPQPRAQGETKDEPKKD